MLYLYIYIQNRKWKVIQSNLTRNHLRNNNDNNKFIYSSYI